MRTILAALLSLILSSAAAQEWPQKPLRLIVPFAPGGLVDNSARVVAEPLGARLGQQVVIENRSGAGGNIGTGAVAQAEPDGYNILAHSSALTIAPALFPALSYDTTKDPPVNQTNRTPVRAEVSRPARSSAA